ncbi:MAG: hypothetical protein COC00_012760 [Rhizobiales bacterium]|nr:hypothetical protein [Hyphomicrobiales bacterium]
MDYYDANEIKVDKFSKGVEQVDQNFTLGAPSREAYSKYAGELALAIVSSNLKVSITDIKRSNRGKTNICVARQVVMYLLHTSMSCSYCEVAMFLSRDRTTVSHGCRLIEDMRDDENFDKVITNMENFALAAMNLASSYSSVGQPDVR